MALQVKDGEIVQVFVSGVPTYGICKTISRRGGGRITLDVLVAGSGVLQKHVVKPNDVRKLKASVQKRVSKVIERAREPDKKTEANPTAYSAYTVKELKDMLRAKHQTCTTYGKKEELLARLADPREESDASSESSDSSEESLFDNEHDDFLEKRLNIVPDHKLKAMLEEYPNAAGCTTHEELVKELVVQITNDESSDYSDSSSEMSDDSQSLGGAEPNDSAIVTKMHELARALLTKTSDSEVCNTSLALNERHKQYMEENVLKHLGHFDKYMEYLDRHAQQSWVTHVMDTDVNQGMRRDVVNVQLVNSVVKAQYYIEETGTTFLIVHGGVQNARTDCIVNAANERCLGGGGIDGVISNMGGGTMHAERLALPIVVPGTQIRCKTGDAVYTSSGAGSGDGTLLCSGVIHAVGPKFRSTFFSDRYEWQQKKDLVLAYKSAMEIARDKGAISVAFCPLSSGIYRGYMSLDAILKLAVNAIKKHTYDGLEVVELHLFSEEEQNAMDSILA